jgi:hypothetical protein
MAGCLLWASTVRPSVRILDGEKAGDMKGKLLSHAGDKN